MKETKQLESRKDAVISFRTPEAIKRMIDREAKRLKQNRAEYVEAVFMSAFVLPKEKSS